jgi:hypothetical protein
MDDPVVPEDGTNPNSENSQENFVRSSFEQFLETCASLSAPGTELVARKTQCCRAGLPPRTTVSRSTPAGAWQTDTHVALPTPHQGVRCCRVEHMKDTWYTTLNVDYQHLLDVRSHRTVLVYGISVSVAERALPPSVRRGHGQRDHVRVLPVS